MPRHPGAISAQYGGKDTLSHKSEAFRSEPNLARMKQWIDSGVMIVLLLWKLIFHAVDVVRAQFKGKKVTPIQWLLLNYPRTYRSSRPGFMSAHADGANEYTHRLVIRLTLDGRDSILRLCLPGFPEGHDVSIPCGWGFLASAHILKREFASLTHEVPPVPTETYTIVIDFVIE